MGDYRGRGQYYIGTADSRYVRVIYDFNVVDGRFSMMGSERFQFEARLPTRQKCGVGGFQGVQGGHREGAVKIVYGRGGRVKTDEDASVRMTE